MNTDPRFYIDRVNITLTTFLTFTRKRKCPKRISYVSDYTGLRTLRKTWLLWKGSQKNLCNNNIAAQLRFVKLYLNKAQKHLSFGEKCSYLILKAEEHHIRKALSECGYSSWTCCESWEVP